LKLSYVGKPYSVAQGALDPSASENNLATLPAIRMRGLIIDIPPHNMNNNDEQEIEGSTNFAAEDEDEDNHQNDVDDGRCFPGLVHL
jgi:hypothetical protein